MLADEVQETEILPAARRVLRGLSMQIGLAAVQHAYPGAGAEKLAAMVRGIQLYQNHPFERKLPPLPEVWRAGQAALYRCAPAKANGRTLLLVPSMINRSYILDLLPGKSFARWLAGEGFDVFLLDWGNPLEDPALENVDALMSERLLPAMDFLSAPFHALGYCMGGTVLAAAAARYGGPLEGLVFLASPWDFHAGKRGLADHVKLGTPSALQIIGSKNHLPVNWIQSVFAAANADRAMQKFLEFSKLDQQSAEARLFVAVEDWLNDGVALPRGVANTCIREWYGENLTAQGKWSVGGEAVDLSAIEIPALIVASKRDRLVPPESALAMQGDLKQAQTLEPDCGHIGMMTGKKAEDQVWRPIAAWIRK